MQGNSPVHLGPSREPARSRSIEMSETYLTNPSGDSEPQVEASAPTAPSLEYETSDPPNSPGEAARISELERSNGELVNTIGKMREEIQLAREQAALEAQIANSQMAMPQPGTAPRPTFESAYTQEQLEKPATVGEVLQALDAVVMPHMAGVAQAQAIRATWDVTPQEEQNAILAYPGLSQASEPNRTQAIVRIVNLQRRTSQSGSVNPPAPNGRADSVRETRSMPGRVVPQVEAPSGGGTPLADPRPDGALQQVQAEYARARAIKDPKERITAMRTAMRKMQQIQGIPDDQVANSGWTDRS